MFIYSFPTCDDMKGCFKSLSNELRVYNRGVKRKNKGQNRSNGSGARALNGANSFFRQQRKFDGEDFPGGAVVKNLPANAGDMGSSPGPGRSHMPRSG